MPTTAAGYTYCRSSHIIILKNDFWCWVITYANHYCAELAHTHISQLFEQRLSNFTWGAMQSQFKVIKNESTSTTLMLMREHVCHYSTAL